MEKQFKFSNSKFIKSISGISLVITIILCLVLVRRQWFSIQVVPIAFLAINFLFLCKTFGVSQILSIRIANEIVTTEYIVPIFRKRYFKCNISDVTVEERTELGFRGYKREFLILKFKDLKPFKICMEGMGWEESELTEIREIFNH